MHIYFWILVSLHIHILIDSFISTSNRLDQWCAYEVQMSLSTNFQRPLKFDWIQHSSSVSIDENQRSCVGLLLCAAGTQTMSEGTKTWSPTRDRVDMLGWMRQKRKYCAHASTLALSPLLITGQPARKWNPSYAPEPWLPVARKKIFETSIKGRAPWCPYLCQSNAPNSMLCLFLPCKYPASVISRHAIAQMLVGDDIEASDRMTFVIQVTVICQPQWTHDLQYPTAWLFVGDMMVSRFWGHGTTVKKLGLPEYHLKSYYSVSELCRWYGWRRLYPIANPAQSTE